MTRQLHRWYITFDDLNVIALLPHNVPEHKAAMVARQQYDILEPLGATSVTLKLTARLYDK